MSQERRMLLMGVAEGTVTELDDRTIKLTKLERKIEKKSKKCQNIQELWGNYKRYNVHVRGNIRKRGKSERHRKNI